MANYFNLNLAPSQTDVTTSNLAWLTVLRGCAAIYVVLHHAVRQVTIVGDHAYDKIFRTIEFLTSFGHYAVDIFIVLSGYCLMLPIIKNNSFGSAAVFIFRRFLRIGIPYYFAIFLSLIAIHFWLGEIDGSHWANTSLPVTTDDLLRHIFFIHQMFEDSANKINPAHWSVGVEFVIYMFFPLLYSISQKFGIVKTTLAVGLITYGLWFICFTYKILNPGFNGTSIYYLLLFMLGASSAYIGRHKEVYSSIFLKILIGHPNASKYVCYFVFFFTASFGIISARYNIFFPLQIQSLLIGFSVAVLLFLFNEKMDTSKGCVYNFFKMMGVIGFSIYLLHDPVVAITWKYIISPMNIASYWMQAVAVACLGLLLSISISGLFFIMIENPMHRLSKIVSY